MVRGQDYSFGWVDSIQMFRVTPEIEERYKNARLVGGDIILTIVGAGTGTLEVVPYWLIGANITQTTARIAIDKEKADSRYCKYYFQSVAGKTQIGLYIKGNAQPGLNIRDVKIFKLPLPPTKAEQTAIADALSDADALISGLEKLIAKKRNIKQGTMQMLLTGKKRLPGFSGKWESKKLGEIAEITMGQSPKSNFYNNEGNGLPLVQGNADIEHRKTIIRMFTSVITKKGYIHNIVMTVRAPVGEIARATFDCCLGRGVCAISYRNDFLYHDLIYLENQWAKLSKGSTFDSINSKEVHELEILIPPSDDEQTAIATVLNDMDAEIESLEQKLNKYKMVKQGMMQELLTGKTRLI